MGLLLLFGRFPYPCLYYLAGVGSFGIAGIHITNLASNTCRCQGISFCGHSLSIAYLKKKKKAANVHCWMTKEMGRKIKESFYNGDGDRGHPKPWCEIQRRQELMAVGLFPPSSPPPFQKTLLHLFLVHLLSGRRILASLCHLVIRETDRLRNTDYSFSWRRKKKNPDSNLLPGSYVWIWVVNVSICGYRYFLRQPWLVLHELPVVFAGLQCSQGNA